MSAVTEAGTSNNGLKQLHALAANRSKISRQVLFEKVAALAIDGADASSQNEIDLMDDILVDLVKFVESTLRAKVAEQLADLATVPRDLIRTLAQDEIDIAKPILVRSTALNDDDLEAVACGRTKDHRLAIANREELSSRVSEVLVSQSEADVAARLLANEGANISPKAFKSIVEMSEGCPDLCVPLLKRGDLPKEAAQQMFWWVSGKLREFILTRHAIEPADLDRLLESATKAALANAERDATAALAIRTKTVRRQFVVSELAAAIKRGNEGEYVKMFAEMAGIGQKAAARIMLDDDGQPLAVACKALEVDKAAFTNLFLVLDFQKHKKARPPAFLNQATATFDKVGPQNAQATLEYWDMQMAA